MNINAITLCVLLLGAGSAGAQDVFYVRSGAEGSASGADWSNAFTALPAQLVRGATYYVADGEYGEWTFATPVSGATTITVRKATTSDHGTATGWQSEYGDGEAFWSKWYIQTGHVIIDGMTRGDDWVSGYGFRVQTPNFTRVVTFTKAVSYVTLRHIDLSHTTWNSIETGSDLIYGIYACDNITIDKCHLHDTTRTMILSRGWTDVVVQYSHFARNISLPSRHSEAWSDHNGTRYTIRHNRFEDIEGTGCVVVLYGTATDWEIYGNVVWWSGSPDFAGFGNGCFTSRSSNAVCNGFKIYNNTVVNHAGRGFNAGHRLYTGENNQVYNNLWYNCGSVGNSTATSVMSHNIVSGGAMNWTPGDGDVFEATAVDPFVNSQNDFRLVLGASSIDAGINVGEPYSEDVAGSVRGADGAWDVGAYEYVETGTLPEEPEEGIASFAASAAAGSGAPTFLTLTWNGEGVTDHLGYKIERSLEAESGFVQIGTAADDAESYRDNALTPGVRYYYRIRSYNASGNGDYSTEADATTPVISGRSVRPQAAGGAGLW